LRIVVIVWSGRSRSLLSHPYQRFGKLQRFMSSRISLLVVCAGVRFAVLDGACFAQDSTSASRKNCRSEEPLSWSVRVCSPSSILSVWRPSAYAQLFHLLEPPLATVEGTYMGVWVSTFQWRKEIATKDEKRIEVGGLKKRWILETSNFPEIGGRLSTLPVTNYFGAHPPSTLSQTRASSPPLPTRSSWHSQIFPLAPLVPRSPPPTRPRSAPVHRPPPTDPQSPPNVPV
jgi:hypothetical protein